MANSPRLAANILTWITLLVSLALFGALLGLSIHNFRDENDQCDEARRLASIADIVASCLGITSVLLGFISSVLPNGRVSGILALLFMLGGTASLWFLGFATGIWSWAHHSKDCLDQEDRRVQKSEWAVSIATAGVWIIPLALSLFSGQDASTSPNSRASP